MTTSRPNVLLIMTDTQNKNMIGAYGLPQMRTPNLDRLAAEGVRFERAYTTCPLCTPARGGIFSGIHPQLNGATYNGVSFYQHIPHVGHYFQRAGYRAAYTGKWHLDGDYPYLGSGEPAPGFEPDWWYDGECYRQDVGEEIYRMCYNGKDLLERAERMPEDPSLYWGHRVADRAIDFMRQAGDAPFFLGVSFDEPHGPYCCPPSYYRDLDPEEFPIRPTFNDLGNGKPELHHIAKEDMGECPEQGLRDHYRLYYGCNRFVDSEIGRVLEAVPPGTIVIYTADHGHCMADYGVWSKGHWMYEPSTNIPLIISGPGFARGEATDALASHVDILPTILNACGVSGLNPLYEGGRIVLDRSDEALLDRNPWIDRLHGVDLAPVLKSPSEHVREHAFISFLRFGNMPKRGSSGNFYPVRCVTDGRYKLVLNMLETDEFYDLRDDPYELENQIGSGAYAGIRDHLHDVLLDFMDDITDPLRSYVWGHREWRSVRRKFYQKPR